MGGDCRFYSSDFNYYIYLFDREFLNHTEVEVANLEKLLETTGDRASKSTESLDWEVEELVHSLVTYRPSEMMTYICSICVQHREVYLWLGNITAPKVPGYGICTSVEEIREMYSDDHDDVVVAFSVNAPGCFHLLLNLFTSNTTSK